MAHAEPGAAEPGEKLCKISEPRLAEVSGLVATKDGYIALPDGGDTLELFELNKKCQVTQRHSFQEDPFDPEDLAITQDGTLWVADVGDNELERDTVALWKIAPDKSSAELNRLTYPDGKHDAEALLMQPDGKPVIVTKDLKGTGISGIYRADQPLRGEEPSPMKKLGEVKLKATGTGGYQYGPVGQKLVTGAAMSPDGKRAVVRTYADAYEWKVSGGDVAKALTKTKPLRTPLPGEPQGESITFSGGKFITATEAVGGEEARLYSYTPTVKPPKPLKSSADDALGWFDQLDLQDFQMIIGAIGVIGLVLLGAGVYGVREARKNRRDGGPPRRGGRGGPDERDYGERPARGSAAVRSGRAQVAAPPRRRSSRGETWGAAGHHDPGPGEPRRRQPPPSRGRASGRAQPWRGDEYGSAPRRGGTSSRPRHPRDPGDEPRYGRRPPPAW